MVKQLLPTVFQDFDKFFVGFEDQFKTLRSLHDDWSKNIPNYPPYNIKKIDDTHYTIEMAVAGFSKNEIDIEMKEGKLVIKGNVETSNEVDDNFLFKGIATRAFTRTFALNDQIEVNNAEMLNGMLKIALERIVPEDKKPKKIKISS